MLSLSQALKEKRLEEFIRQQEAKGVGPIDEAAFLKAASKVIKHEQQSYRTWRSALRDGSTEK